MREYSRTDRQYQHDYQRILWQGAANGATDAWFNSGYQERMWKCTGGRVRWTDAYDTLAGAA